MKAETSAGQGTPQEASGKVFDLDDGEQQRALTGGYCRWCGDSLSLEDMDFNGGLCDGCYEHADDDEEDDV